MKISWILIYIGIFIICLFISGFLFWRFLPPITSSTTAATTVDTAKQPFDAYTFDAAPNESLPVVIATVSGEVVFESRVATEPAALTTTTLHQGELLITKEKSFAVVEVASLAAQVAENSSLSMIQTLPHKLVFGLESGTVTFGNHADDPVQIKIKRLLVLLSSQSQFAATYDQGKDYASLKVSQGSISLAYNNSNFKTQHATVSAGQSVVFDNTKRTLKVTGGRL